jgi:arylformamidase
VTKFFDISLPLTPQLPTWPGNARYEFQPVKRIASGDSSNVSRVVLGTHSGTHIDAPRHFFDQGRTVDELPLDQLVGPCLVVELELEPGRTPITAGDLQRAVGAGRPERLLLKTPNSGLWGTRDFTPDFAYLSPEAAEWVVASGIRLVGIDYLSIEEFRRSGAPTHHILLGAEVIIIEGLNLADVSPGAYDLACLPLRLVGSDGAPARVILRGEK